MLCPRERQPLAVGFACVYGALALAWTAAGSVAALYGALVAGMAAVAVVHFALVAWGGWTEPLPRQNGSAPSA